jgi:hypothetical protein
MTPNKSADETDKPFHSHTFAEVANRASIGATSSQSFGQRYQINQNRMTISKYRDSYVASGDRIREELQRHTDNTSIADLPQSYGTTRRGYNTISKPSSITRSVQIPRRSFSEPSARKYNPFS